MLPAVLSKMGMTVSPADLRSLGWRSQDYESWLLTELDQEVLSQDLAAFSSRLSMSAGRATAVSQLVDAYLDCFGDSMQHLDLLTKYAHNSGISVHSNIAFWESTIRQRIAERAQERRANEIAKAVSTGKPLVRKTSISDLDLFTGEQFEHFLDSIFSAMGYRVQLTKLTGDQGGDLVIEKSGDRVVVQAKRYSDRVGNSAIQEVVAAKAYYACSRAMVVTTAYFTKGAAELAAANAVELWDRDKLSEQMQLHL